MRLEDPSGGTLLPSGLGALGCLDATRHIGVMGAVPVQGESADPGAFLGSNPSGRGLHERGVIAASRDCTGDRGRDQRLANACSYIASISGLANKSSGSRCTSEKISS